MTKTARDLRSAAHALRTAANALEETEPGMPDPYEIKTEMEDY